MLHKLRRSRVNAARKLLRGDVEHVSGRLRLAVISDFKRITQHIAPGATHYTDGLKTFTGLEEAGYTHLPSPQPQRTDLRKGTKSVVPLATVLWAT